MDTKLLKRVKAIKAMLSTDDTGEKWICDDGKILNIDRKPIDWALIIEKENKDEKHRFAKQIGQREVGVQRECRH